MNEVRKFHDKLVSREDLGLWAGDVAPILDEVDAVDLRDPDAVQRGRDGEDELHILRHVLRYRHRIRYR